MAFQPENLIFLSKLWLCQTGRIRETVKTEDGKYDSGAASATDLYQNVIYTTGNNNVLEV